MPSVVSNRGDRDNVADVRESAVMLAIDDEFELSTG
jgi:hypothetical protein